MIWSSFTIHCCLLNLGVFIYFLPGDQSSRVDSSWLFSLEAQENRAQVLGFLIQGDLICFLERGPCAPGFKRDKHRHKNMWYLLPRVSHAMNSEDRWLPAGGGGRTLIDQAKRHHQMAEACSRDGQLVSGQYLARWDTRWRWSCLTLPDWTDHSYCLSPTPYSFDSKNAALVYPWYHPSSSYIQ